MKCILSVSIFFYYNWENREQLLNFPKKYRISNLNVKLNENFITYVLYVLYNNKNIRYLDVLTVFKLMNIDEVENAWQAKYNKMQ